MILSFRLTQIISFTSNSINATSERWLFDGQFTGITGNLWNDQITTGVHTISLVADDGTCTDTTTVVYFSAGSPHSIDTFMLANYGRADVNHFGTAIDNTLDGGYLLGGYNAHLNLSEQGTLVKLKDRGCIEWSKYLTGLTGYSSIEIQHVYASPDSNYYVAGIYSAGIPFLMKLDKNANVAWIKNWRVGGIPYNMWLNCYAITCDPSGNVYVAGNSIDNGFTITRISPSGNIDWNKYYNLSGYDPLKAPSNPYSDVTGLLWQNGKLFFTGLNFLYTGYYATQVYNFMTRVDAASGTTEWQYGYSDDASGIQNTMMGFRGISAYNNLLMVAGAGSGQWVTLITPQGNVVKSIQATFTNSFSSHETRAEADNSGHIYLMQWDEQTLPLQPGFQYYTNFAKFDTSLKKFWGLSYSDYFRGYFTDAALGSNHLLAAVGTDFGYIDDGEFTARNIRVMKIDTPAVPTDLNCNYLSSFNLSARNINKYDFKWDVDSLFTPVDDIPPSMSVTDAYIQSRYSCPDFIDSCSFMRVSGPKSICSYFNTYYLPAS